MKLAAHYSAISHYGRLVPVYDDLAREWGRVDDRPDLWAGVVYVHPGGYIFPVDRAGDVLMDETFEVAS